MIVLWRSSTKYRNWHFQYWMSIAVFVFMTSEIKTREERRSKASTRKSYTVLNTVPFIRFQNSVSEKARISWPTNFIFRVRIRIRRWSKQTSLIRTCVNCSILKQENGIFDHWHWLHRSATELICMKSHPQFRCRDTEVTSAKHVFCLKTGKRYFLPLTLTARNWHGTDMCA